MAANIPRLEAEVLINHVYKNPYGQILINVEDRSHSWGLAVISGLKSNLEKSATMLASRHLFYQRILPELEDVDLNPDIKKDLAYYLLANKCDYNIKQMEKNEIFKIDNFTISVIKVKSEQLKYSYSSKKVDQGFYQYLWAKALYISDRGDYQSSTGRFRYIWEHTNNKQLELKSLLYSIKYYEQKLIDQSRKDLLEKIITQDDYFLYKYYNVNEIKLLVHYLEEYYSLKKAKEMAGLFMMLFPEESYFEQIFMKNNN